MRPVAWFTVAACAPAFAGTVRVDVVDEQGRAIEEVAVYLQADTRGPSVDAGAPTAVMDQKANAFVPHILVVQTGTAVIFPNSDTVSHHVYSFSPTKPFELGLYKGNVHSPVSFDEPGLVVLGCNIHDGMLGYILIVDTPHFALTDERGAVTIESVPEGRYTVNVWTPRARPSQLPATAAVDVTATQSATVALAIRGKLMPAHDHFGLGLTWERY
jgi:plastocyanin